MKAVEEIRQLVVSAFEQLDPSVKEALADLDSPMQRGFAALALAEDNTEYKTLSATTISDALEAAGVAVEPKQISNAFNKAGDRIKTNKTNEGTYYRLMTTGKREIEPLLEVGPLRVSYIEAGKPRTARKFLKGMLGDLSGKVRISDPWYGERSLDSLAMIPQSCTVQFLTAQAGGNKASKANLPGALKDFKREHPNVELRKIPNPKQLHDRYILAGDDLLILGHGIKDIGERESFVITISKKVAPDLITSMQGAFNSRWSGSQPI